jgi:hypothetical protein
MDLAEELFNKVEGQFEQLLKTECEDMTFDLVVADVAKRDGVPSYIAMQTTRRTHPELFAKFQAEPITAPERITKSAEHERAERDLQRAADEIRSKNPKMTRTAALSEARKNFNLNRLR